MQLFNHFSCSFICLVVLNPLSPKLRYEKTFITKNSITNPTNFYTAQPRMLRSLCENFRSLAQKTTELWQFFKNWQNSRQFKRFKDIPAMHFFQSLMEETKISVISRCEPRHVELTACILIKWNENKFFLKIGLNWI